LNGVKFLKNFLYRAEEYELNLRCVTHLYVRKLFELLPKRRTRTETA